MIDSTCIIIFLLQYFESKVEEQKCYGFTSDTQCTKRGHYIGVAASSLATLHR